ncbi:P-loop NTPase fold protein [Desulfobaculum bizertense]|uniref:KAP family P-loop domain-containing protein n=1 Tax=Desulfobaculum bizertense DSM 18034 TaxID=1121442 RepID=A0A1T4WXX6_9BACT|nr:P-loop NTPase fold protein [Desulfobaculum bizertense]SKA81718.1 KAP family P-loop domain-containing protein [Desulfobaculum bizertense DSM 18034]
MLIYYYPLGFMNPVVFSSGLIDGLKSIEIGFSDFVEEIPFRIRLMWAALSDVPVDFWILSIFFLYFFIVYNYEKVLRRMPKENDSHPLWGYGLESELLRYIFEKRKVEQAFVVDGKWGVGKTFFVTKFFKKYKKRLKSSGLNPVFISLNGISTVEDLEAEFFRANTKQTRKLGILLGRAVARSALKRVSLGVKEFSLFWGKIKPFTKNDILVVDDVERCVVCADNIFGYINQIVEKQHIKLILIMNQEELVKNSEMIGHEAKVVIHDTLEKVVFRRWTVLADFDSFFKNYTCWLQSLFLNESECLDAGHACMSFLTFIKENKAGIKFLFDDTRFCNIRLFSNGLEELRSIFMGFSDDIYENKNFIKRFAGLFLIFYVENRLGKLDLHDFFEGEIIQGSEMGMNFENPKKEAVQSNYLKNKYKEYSPQQYRLPGWVWLQLLKDGVNSWEAVLKEIKTSTLFQTEIPWVKLWHFDEPTEDQMTDDEFFDLVTKQKEILFNEELKDVLSVLHIAGLLKKFNDRKMFKVDIEKVLFHAEKNLEKLRDQKELIHDYEKLREVVMYNCDIQHLSTEYIDCQDGKFFPNLYKKAQKCVKEQWDSQNKETLPDLILKSLETRNFDLLRELVVLEHSGGKYAHTPVFNFFDPQKFYSKLVGYDSVSISFLSGVFHQRYNFLSKESAQELFPEKGFAESLKKIIDSEWDEESYAPNKEELRDLKDRILPHALENFNKF